MTMHVNARSEEVKPAEHEESPLYPDFVSSDHLSGICVQRSRALKDVDSLLLLPSLLLLLLNLFLFPPSLFLSSPLHPHRVVVQGSLAEGGPEEVVLEEEEEGEEEAD